MSEMSGYRIMWTITFFDLPVGTKQQQRDATEFRNTLLKWGFQMTQFSVYFKYCKDKSQSDALVARIMQVIPPDGKVDILVITDKQYANISTVRGERTIKRKNPSQLLLF